MSPAWIHGVLLHQCYLTLHATHVHLFSVCNLCRAVLPEDRDDFLQCIAEVLLTSTSSVRQFVQVSELVQVSRYD
jgi:hypothetical protein